MKRKLRNRLLLILGAMAAASVYIAPSLGVIPSSMKWFPVKSKVNLGLDLQGGSYLAFGVSLNQAAAGSLDAEMIALKESLTKKQIDISYKAHEISESSSEGPSVVMTCPQDKKDEVESTLGSERPNLTYTDIGPGQLQVAFTTAHLKEIQEQTLAQSVEVVRNRIDQFGVAEPSISTKGDDRIVVELPGVHDVENAKNVIGRTALLEFHMVDDEKAEAIKLGQLIADIEKQQNLTFSDKIGLLEYTHKINEAAGSKVPDDREILFERVPGEARLVPYLVEKSAPVTGGDLSDARVEFGEYGQAEVGFTFKPDAAKKFETLTAEHIHRRMAIVLDGSVMSAPVIQTTIGGGKGVITLGQKTANQMKEASDLAIVLRAGALPATLNLLEQRVVGPSLGQDSIKHGVFAGILGCLAIFAFMIYYYRLSGGIASLSLIFNLVFSFAILIGFGATLTLPGIAGLALVIGMGVDSNVIIFERIRDELLEGSSVKGAVERGFDRAFRAIFDANITHGIVGLVLFYFGSGPLKGFAVTLLIGIFTTLFCAITVCKTFFDLLLERRPETLSI